MKSPYSRRIIKATARRNFKSVANNSYKHGLIQPYLNNALLHRMKNELRHCQSAETDSLLLHSLPSDLASFSFSALKSELKEYAQTFYNFLHQLTSIQKKRASEQSTIICICAAIIFKYRHPDMSLIQKLISGILFAGHCSKEVQNLS